MKRDKIRLLKVSGTPFELGYQHGAAYREEIQRYTAERVALVQGGAWSGGPLPRAAVLELAEACVPAHEAYAPDLVEELRGLAQATGLTLGELIITGGFTDFVDTVYGTYHRTTPLEPELAIDDCTAFIVPDARAEGAGFFGQTWDMHDSAEEFVIMLDVQPTGGTRALTFTTMGCLGQIGMNEHGIAVGINNLLGADGQIGVTWPFVVRKVLQQRDMDAALACITEAPLAGAHNFMLFDASGRGYNIEAMSTRHEITPLADEPLVHTNHCLLPTTNALAQPRPADAQQSSEQRLATAIERLAEDDAVDGAALQRLTRQAPICHEASSSAWHVATCGAAIMRPRTRELWAVWGLPSDNEYERFVVS